MIVDNNDKRVYHDLINAIGLMSIFERLVQMSNKKSVAMVAEDKRCLIYF